MPAWKESPKSPFDLTLYQLMKDVHEVLDEGGVEYFAIGGTLLGAVRHGGFIPWDDDLDLALPDANIPKFEKVIPRFVALGYRVLVCKAWDGWKIERHFDLPSVFGRKQYALCDIFSWKTDNAGYLRYQRAPWKFGVLPEIVFPRQKLKFGETEVWGPANPKGFLDLEVGSNWETQMVKHNHFFKSMETHGKQAMGPDDYLPSGPFGPLVERVHPVAPPAAAVAEEKKT